MKTPVWIALSICRLFAIQGRKEYAKTNQNTVHYRMFHSIHTQGKWIVNLSPMKTWKTEREMRI